MADPRFTQIGQYAEKALLVEVALTPKPGLVDRRTNGAHTDMDFYTFIDSIVSLTPFFPLYIEAGFTHANKLTQLFSVLRQIGQKAEEKMLQATHGVNTHKGANFSFALLLGATGVHLKNGACLPFTAIDTREILALSATIAKEVLLKDFQNLTKKKQLSHGEKLYLDYGILGIRGEAINGYPSLALLLDFLRGQTEPDTELRLLQALIFLMSKTEDGNLLHRGGIQAWKQVKKECSLIHQKNPKKEQLITELIAYDKILTARNLSPGGSADLLALGIYFSLLEGLFSIPVGKKV